MNDQCKTPRLSPVSTFHRLPVKITDTADRVLVISACGDFIYSNSRFGSWPAPVHVFLFKHFCCVVRFRISQLEFSLLVEFIAHIIEVQLDWEQVFQRTPEFFNGTTEIHGKII